MKQTVGQQLRTARESREISLDEAVKATHISRTYLQELENDHPEVLLSGAQARGFLRLYASFLGIPSAPLIAQWEEKGKGEEPGELLEDMVDQSDSVDAGSGPEISKPSDAESDQPETEMQGKKTIALADVLSSLIERIRIIPTRNISTEEEPDAKLERAVEAPVQVKQESPTEPVLADLRSSADIFRDIGFALRERRSALELTLSDVERFTNVKRMYLNAMEDGHFNKLPSTVQGRGMLNNYSKFLALDESWIMDAYARALQSRLGEHDISRKRKIQPPLTVRLNIPEKWRRFLNPDLVIGGFFIIALFGFIIWGGAQVFKGPEPIATEAPSISEMLQQSSTPIPEMIDGEENNGELSDAEATPIPGVTIAQSTPTQIATVNAAPLQLYIIAHDRAYLNVTVDGFEAFSGRVLPDNVYTYSGKESIDLVTGNGAALEVYFNQEYLGELGRVGEVKNITFSLKGLSTPTPKATRTPTVEQMPEEGSAMEAMEN
jgi:cytoskeleton protein RodZ